MTPTPRNPKEGEVQSAVTRRFEWSPGYRLTSTLPIADADVPFTDVDDAWVIEQVEAAITHFDESFRTQPDDRGSPATRA